MARLNIQLFQTLRLSTAEHSDLVLGSPTTRSLFAYLVLHHHQYLDRRHVAYLFWPRGTEAAARRNLRQYLHRIRRALEPVDPEGAWLSTEGHQIRFNPPEEWWLDVAAFEQAGAPPQDNLAYAVTLYQGDLLEDIYDDWVVAERDRLARLYRQYLLRLIDQQEVAGNLARAVAYAEAFLAAEPLLETAYRRLMHLHYLAGNRGKVKLVYQQLRHRLQSELGAEPLAETTATYQAMLAGEYNGNLPGPPPDLLAPPAAPRPAPLKAALFIGRAAELAWLDQARQEAWAGRGGFYLVQGESGIGKTRLLTEWLSRLQGPAIVLQSRCYEFESMIPYRPLVQALHEAATQPIPWELFRPSPPWLGALLPLLPELPALMPGTPHAPAQPSLPGSSQHHIIEAAANFLLTLAGHRPLVLFIDNLHWADTPTWNFLGFLSRRAAQASILLLGTARAEDMPQERTRLARDLQRRQLLHALTLARFTEDETATLVNQLLDEARPDAGLVRRIFQETEGNPFFIIETVRAVQEAGGQWAQRLPPGSGGQRPSLAIPLQVQAVIESRLDKLGEESHMALGVAATIGREFSFALLQEVSQLKTEVLLNALDEWLGRGIVRETADGYDFTHEKLSQVAYQRLSRARRQWIHRRVADSLSRGGRNPAQIAHHYTLSDDPARALPYLAQAGQEALSIRSYAEAREFGLRAVGLLGRFPNPTQTGLSERLDLNLQLGQAYAFTGSHEKALQMLREAERLAEALGDMERLARIFYRSAQIFWLRGQVATAHDYARRTLRHAEELDEPALRYGALRMLGRTSIVLSQYDDAIAYLLRYIDLAEREITPPALPLVYGYLGVAYARVGSWQRAIASAQRGLELAGAELPGATHVVARMQLAFVHAELREWDRALAVAGPAREQWREKGMSPHAFMLRVVVGRCLTEGEAPEQGLAEMRAALQWASEADHRVLVHVTQLYLAQALAQAGKQAEALAAAANASQLAAAVGDGWAEAVALRLLAEVGMQLPRPDWPELEANLIQAMHRLRQIRARPDLARTYLALRRLYDRAGQMAWAVDCHFRATTIFDELGMEEERRQALGRPAGERTGAVVLPGLKLRGPNAPPASSQP